jgi:hypothetical protein
MLGILFSLRGMELGIPYLSPQTAKMQQETEKILHGDDTFGFRVCH